MESIIDTVFYSTTFNYHTKYTTQNIQLMKKSNQKLNNTRLC